MGMPATARKKTVVQIHPETTGDHKNVGPAKKTAARKAPAKANHLICWRSRVRARLKRTTSETAEASIVANISKKAENSRRSLTPASASTPKGLATEGNSEFLSGPGPKACAKVTTAIAMAASQATGRQRRVGSRPSGNSRSRNAKIPSKPGPPIHAEAQAMMVPPGSGSDRASRAKVA